MNEMHEKLNPAKGMMIGMGIGIVFWTLIIILFL